MAGIFLICHPDRSGGIVRRLRRAGDSASTIERVPLCERPLLHPEDGMRSLHYTRDDRIIVS
jgi:hypothetical protein